MTFEQIDKVCKACGNWTDTRCYRYQTADVNIRRLNCPSLLSDDLLSENIEIFSNVIAPKYSANRLETELAVSMTTELMNNTKEIELKMLEIEQLKAKMSKLESTLFKIDRLILGYLDERQDIAVESQEHIDIIRRMRAQQPTR